MKNLEMLFPGNCLCARGHECTSMYIYYKKDTEKVPLLLRTPINFDKQIARALKLTLHSIQNTRNCLEMFCLTQKATKHNLLNVKIMKHSLLNCFH